MKKINTLKVRHKEVKFTAAEMAEDVPDDTDFSKMLFVGRGKEGMELARRISQAKGEDKRKLLASLRPMQEPAVPSTTVTLDPDVAKVFTDGKAINNILRAVIQNTLAVPKKKLRKTA